MKGLLYFALLFESIDLLVLNLCSEIIVKLNLLF